MASTSKDYEKVYELTGVSDQRLPDVTKNFKTEGAVSTEVILEPDGLWTVRAKFDLKNVKKTG